MLIELGLTLALVGQPTYPCTNPYQPTSQTIAVQSEEQGFRVYKLQPLGSPDDTNQPVFWLDSQGNSGTMWLQMDEQQRRLR